MADIHTFQIAVPDSVLADLKERLQRTRWPDHECVDDWSQGTPLAYTRELAEYWEHEYDWRAREAALDWMDCDDHPENWCEANYHITRWTDMPRGGHFTPFEQPELFVEDTVR